MLQRDKRKLSDGKAPSESMAVFSGGNYMNMHFATIWESYADQLGDVPAVIDGDKRLSWSQYDDRAARIAAALTAAGLGPDDKSGLYLYNSAEYLEAHYGSFKQRVVPINVNFRYLGNELEYLLDNADCKALFYHASLADRVVEVVGKLPLLRLIVEVDDGPATAVVPGRVKYEDLIARNEPAPRIERSGDDIYMLYTGGTTGMPKGVMYTMGSHTQQFVMNGLVALGLPLTDDWRELAPLMSEVRKRDGTYVVVPCCPLMHGTGMWIGAMIPHAVAGTVAILQNRKFDANELLSLVETERVQNVVIVGDAFARPIADALDAAQRAGKKYDTSSLTRMVSSGVMWTTEAKRRLIDHIPQIALLDAMGSTEGSMGSSVMVKDAPAETAVFIVNPATKLFDDEDNEVLPGSGGTGKVASGGHVPIGYFKDPEKSARTFRTIGGVHYSFPGDLGTYDDNGNLVLLGRGSQVINTAGEKVFPEEVEEAVKRNVGVRDCLVVGLPDEKFGQIVVAVASVDVGVTLTEADVIASVKKQLSGYKAPKRVVFVSEVPRAPNGKADYPGARALAEK